MSRPWYLSPEALAVIAAMDGKPDVEWSEKTYVLTTDRFARFTGAAYDKLADLFSAEFLKTSDKDRFELFRQGTAEDVVGALFGDCYGNDQYITHRDMSPEWEEIRRNVDAALREAEFARVNRGHRVFARDMGRAA